MKKLTILLAVALLVLSAMIISCSPPKPEPPYASGITENVLTGLNQNDFAKFSQDFDEAMKKAFTEQAFAQTRDLLKSKVGDYQSKQFLKTEEQKPYAIVYYKAQFTNEPDGVIVRIVFQEVEGKAMVSGLWFDSPNLRK